LVRFAFARKVNDSWWGEPPEMTAHPKKMANNPVEVGDELRISLEEDSHLERNTHTAGFVGHQIIHVYGEIKYLDNRGISRSTSFCWPYDIGARDFRKPLGEDEYNYED
jgi:hypothetical protein